MKRNYKALKLQVSRTPKMLYVAFQIYFYQMPVP